MEELNYKIYDLIYSLEQMNLDSICWLIIYVIDIYGPKVSNQL